MTDGRTRTRHRWVWWRYCNVTSTLWAYSYLRLAGWLRLRGGKVG